MTETNFSSGRFGSWHGQVVDRDDPLKAGRVKVRIFGVHDDEQNVPDKDLPWVHPAGSITSSSLNHIGWSPTGIQVGSTVSGYYADSDYQIPIFTGSHYRAEIKDAGEKEKKQPESPDKKNDIAPNARGTQKTGVKDETNLGKDHVHTIDSAIPTKAEDAEKAKKDDNVKHKKMKHAQKPTIGHVDFKDGQKVLEVIKKIDPENKSGAIKSAVDGMKMMKNMLSGGSSLGGTDMLGSLMSGFMQSGGQGGGGTGGGGGQGGTQTNNINIEQFAQQFMQGNTTIGENTANSQQPQQSGGGQGGGMGNILQTLISAITQQFSGAGGEKGGLGSFDDQHGVMKKLEEAHSKIFEKLQ